MRKLILIALLLGFVGGLVVAASPNARASLDFALLRIDKLERKLRYQFGLPQPGQPDLARLDERLKAAGVALGDPIFMRVFKRESELELWVKKGETFTLFATYPICRWSGGLGPKLKTGDKQAPEGFYTVAAHQLNPKSRWHRSFNLGFPNLYDRGQGRTGSFLMVHGGCTSVGCYAVTNEIVDEIWQFVTAALKGGQKRFAVHAFPFRMTALNMAMRSGHRDHGFWADLKPGYDAFEATRIPPAISLCNGRYAVEPGQPSSLGNDRLEARCPARTATLSQ